MTTAHRPNLAWIGAGRAAGALAPLLAAAGYPTAAVASRTPAAARRLARRLPGAAAVPAGEAVLRANVVLLAVPDGALEAVAEALSRVEPPDGRARTFLHLCGARGPAALRPLAERGAATGVWHPLQSLAVPELAAELVPGSRVRIEGDPRAVRVARRLSRALGLVPLRLPGRLTDRDRAAYHAAAAVAGNDLGALLGAACDLLRRIGLDEREALRALIPLVRGSLRQIERRGLARALTGPAVRGDAETLAAHLEALAAVSPGDVELHRRASLRLLEMVRGTERAPSGAATGRVRATLRPTRPGAGRTRRRTV